MKVLVTGGCGFIGTHLVRGLVGAGHAVRVLDLERPAKAEPGVDYRQGDVLEADDLIPAIADTEAVFHFSAMGSIPLCQEFPDRAYQHNLIATVKVLEALRRERILNSRSVRLVFAGSGVVYGAQAQDGESCREDRNLPSPLSFYGAQKLGCEHAVLLFARQFQIPVVAFRFFNAYGPGQDPGSPYSGVMTLFAHALQHGASLHLNGGGAQTRDFISVHDIVAANLKALKIPSEQCNGEPINLGSGIKLSVRELALQMIAATGSAANLVDRSAREGDVPHSLADISRAKNVLRWMPEITLKQGLKEICEPYSKETTYENTDNRPQYRN